MNAEESSIQEIPVSEEMGAGARVLREVIRTPAFSELIKTNIASVDPECARDTIRTILWEDTGLSLGVLAKSPALVNYAVEAILELGEAFGGFPAPLLEEFLVQLSSEIDGGKFKEIPQVYGPLLETILLESPAIREKMIKGLYSNLNGSLRAAATVLSRLQDEAGLIGTIEHEPVDAVALGQAVNAFSKMMMTIHEENPDLVKEAFPTMEKALNEIDFGKMRVALTGLIEDGTVAAEQFIDVATDNPVIIANLFGVAPPMINNLLRVISHLTSNLDLPAEILASATFNILSDLDAGKIGEIVTSASKLIGELHEGNLVMGGDEPALKPVLNEFVERVLATTDIEAAASALAALGEDSEVIFDVASDLLCRDPELLTNAISAGVSFDNSVTRGLAVSLRKFSQLPDDDLARMGEEVKNLDVKEGAEVLNSLLVYSRRFFEANPDLGPQLISDYLGAVDTEQVGLALQATSKQLGALKDDPVVKQFIGPEEVGLRLNELLVKFNSMEGLRPGAMSEYASSLIAQVDTGELKRAFKKVAVGFLKGVWSTLRLIFDLISGR